MNKFLKLLLALLVCLIVSVACNRVYNFALNQNKVENLNICQDNDLITKLIMNNSNPFSKMRFIKKRNTDCKILLINNTDEALAHKKPEFCSIIDDSTNSVTMLILAYVNEMYDRDSASKEFNNMVPLMTPYNYCPEYMPNMTSLIKIKKRLGL